MTELWVMFCEAFVGSLRAYGYPSRDLRVGSIALERRNRWRLLREARPTGDADSDYVFAII